MYYVCSKTSFYVIFVSYSVSPTGSRNPAENVVGDANRSVTGAPSCGETTNPLIQHHILWMELKKNPSESAFFSVKWRRLSTQLFMQYFKILPWFRYFWMHGI